MKKWGIDLRIVIEAPSRQSACIIAKEIIKDKLASKALIVAYDNYPLPQDDRERVLASYPYKR